MATRKSTASAGAPRPDRVELPWPQKLSVSDRGMIATAHWAATQAGVETLEAGGNAIDAAVAAAFALGVCEPAASGLGGQTMMVVHHAESGRTIAVDGSSRAPNRATPGRLDAAQRRRGHASTTVPATPAALDHARSRWGRLPLSRILAPAIRLADGGVPVSELQHRLTQRELPHLRQSAAGAVFLRSDRPLAPGTVLRQPALAETLARLAKKGIADFYSGQIAKEIHADMQANGGLLHRDDLAQVPVPIERRPLSGRFEGLRLMTMPPPGAGRTLLLMLNVLSELSESLWLPDTPDGAVVLAHVIRRAFLDRQDRPFDPHLWAQVAERRMLTAEYAETVARQVERWAKAGPVPGDGDPRESGLGASGRDEGTHGETTHLSAADAEGNMVALTQSIEQVYGACVLTPSLGFLYNDYMSAFEYEDISHPYYLRPNAAPWASVAPTLVFRGKRPWLAIGSPGSQRIVPSIVQVLVRLLDGTAALDAVTAPRLYCGLDGRVSLEASRMRDDIPAALLRAGLSLDAREPFAFYLGCIQLVMREGAQWIGVADPRRDGAAGGPRDGGGRGA
jgi:gamma-glutamyltranspeptidase/glutathione hydrolase